MDPIISYEKFGLIVSECMVMLKDEGFPCEAACRRQVSEIFRQRIFNVWFGPVEPPPIGSVVVQRMLTQELLDGLTLQCAVRFIKHGVEKVSADDSLNYIREGLLTLLEFSGHITEKDRQKIFGNMPIIWTCYFLWVDVARKDGMHETDIGTKRNDADLKYPSLFEDPPYFTTTP